MPWIQNVSYKDVIIGDHMWDEDTVLIRIVDPLMEFPEPAKEFRDVYHFEFLDLEDKDTFGEEFKITKDQAEDIVKILMYAMKNDYNVVVHCVAGICRSGAVAEVGIMLGFKDTYYYRSPNLLVKHSLMRVLGWTYDSEEPNTINGVPFYYDELNNKEFHG